MDKGVGKIIRFERVTKRFKDGTEALKNITVDIPKNKLTVIIGPSGSGKTTLMRMINRLENPTEGEVFIDDKPVSKMNVVELRRSIGYVIQQIGLIPHMTIEENIALVPNLLGWDKKKTKQRVQELLEMVNLPPETYMHKYPVELSGGQQQRVGVIRALAGDPDIILMDEPFSALDPISREQLQHELKLLQQKIHKTIVFVTHDMDEALDIADYIIIMRDGKIEQMAMPEELIKRQKNAFVREFIGEKRLENMRPVAERPIREFKHVFKRNPIEPYTSVLDTASIKEAVRLLEKEDKHALEVKRKDEKVIGYVHAADLLKAITGVKGFE